MPRCYPGKVSGGESAASRSERQTASARSSTKARGPLTADRHMRAGTPVGRYVIIGEVGRGAMGQVVRAYDPKLEREVALKALLSGGDGFFQLRDEARAMARLVHPNVVAVYDVERVERFVFLVMEFVEGTTLRAWLKQEKRSAVEVLERYLQAGRGLAAAHDAGLLHCDFKPANVLVSRNGAVKVADFGVSQRQASARRVESDSSGDLDADETAHIGLVVGTPRYMAPEQHRGDPLTAAADQYAFAVAVWEGLTGSPPFRPPLSTMAAAKRSGPPQWPNARAPRRVVRALQRALSPNPLDRYPNMHALLQALRGRSGLARSPLFWSSSAIVGLGAVAAIANAGDSKCATAQSQLAEAWSPQHRERLRIAFDSVDSGFGDEVSRRTLSHLDAYGEVWTQIHTEACEATHEHGTQSEALLDQRVRCLHEARDELDATVAVLSEADGYVLERAHLLLEPLFPLERCSDLEGLSRRVSPPDIADADAVELARAQLTRATVNLRAARHDDARANLGQALDALRDVEYEPAIAESELVEGRLLRAAGDYTAAQASLEAAVERAVRTGQDRLVQDALIDLIQLTGGDLKQPEQAFRYAVFARGLAESPTDRANLAAAMGSAHSVRADYEQAELFYRDAYETLAQTRGADEPTLADIRTRMADAILRQGRYEEARAEHEWARASLSRSLGKHHPSTAMTSTSLGNVAYAKGDYEAAKRHHLAALQDLLAAVGERHPHVAVVRNNLGNTLQQLGDNEGSEHEHRLALEIREAQLGASSPSAAESRNNLASTLSNLGRHEEAEAQYRRSLELRLAQHGPDHPSVAQSRQNLAIQLAMRGQHSEARREFKLAASVIESRLGRDHPKLAKTLFNLALTHVRAQEHVEALGPLRRALTIYEAQFPSTHPAVLSTQRQLARTLVAAGREQEALPYAEASWKHAHETQSQHEAELGLILAKVLARSTDAADRQRAMELAHATLDLLRASPDRDQESIEEVRRWIAGAARPTR